MLQHESAPEVSPRTFTSRSPSSLTPQEAEAVTPQELAQAIVAVEDGQGVSLQSGAEAAVIQQAIAQSGVAVTPDQLLAEVHRQRGQSHQNSAMTPHLTQNLSVRLLIALGIFASLAALFLLYTSLMFANRFSDASEALAKYKSQTELKTVPLTALQRLQAWNYPGAQTIGSSNSTYAASATMTTKDVYAQVWKHYAGQTGFLPQKRSTTFMQGKGPKPGLDPAIPFSEESGTYTEDGQTIHYNADSSVAGDTQITTFTLRSPQYTVVTTLLHNANSPDTTINTVATTPAP